MIHKIKALYDKGRGSSIREISRALKVSRNTVRKYLAMDEESIGTALTYRERHKVLDEYRGYITYLLESYPKLSAVKVKRKVEQKVGALGVSSRSFRRYLKPLRAQVLEPRTRYYEPIIDDIPAVQCQVDGGELRGVSIDGRAATVYFVVFVLSYSRQMYVSASESPINTERFMHMHDEAFRAFGGCPEHCLYDQARLVVLSERFRELELNPRFAQYATAAGFRIRACEGYDPESKGKVEAGVKYVKNDALYGEQFSDWPQLHNHLQQWLGEVANVRTHATTGERPQALYDAKERALMRAYLTPSCLTDNESIAGEPRKVDKTGLISFRSNKYSVPMAYQCAEVHALASPDGLLQIYSSASGELIATHPLSQAKGAIIKIGNHYRDKEQVVATFEAEIFSALGESLGERLCTQLRRTDPQHYKDKLRGIKRHLERICALPDEQLSEFADRPGLTVSTVLEYLSAWEANPERMAKRAACSPRPSQSCASDKLAEYAQLSQSQRPERHHEFH